MATRILRLAQSPRRAQELRLGSSACAGRVPLLRNNGAGAFGPVLNAGGGRLNSSQSSFQRPGDQGSLAARLTLANKVTVITGASRGIGLAFVKDLVTLGTDVALMDISEPSEDVDALAQRHGVRLKYYKTDVANEDSIASSFRCAKQDFGRIDNCITAAGIALESDFLSHTWEQSRKVLEINVLGSFFCAQQAASCMKQQGTPGSIVMIASVAAHCALPGQYVSMYGASKAAVKLLGKTLAVEMAPYNIRVNTISPGFIRTEMSGALAVKKPELFEVFRTAPPLLRIGEREDLTMAAAYLLSPSASYVTGEDLAITGGLHAGRIYPA